MNYNDLEDQALIQLVIRSDEGALSALYDRYAKLVYSIALNAIGEQGLAEEIVQEVFIRIWEKASSFDSNRGKLYTWIVSITRNRSIDLLRKSKTRRESIHRYWTEFDLLEETTSENPERRAESQIEQQRVRAALRQLPEEQRQALALAYFKGLSQSEIANVLDEPLGTIKTRIRLGMKKLRALLEPMEHRNPNE